MIEYAPIVAVAVCFFIAGVWHGEKRLIAKAKAFYGTKEGPFPAAIYVPHDMSDERIKAAVRAAERDGFDVVVFKLPEEVTQVDLGSLN